MSSTGANRESEGGTLKNVIDDPATKPQSHIYAENQSGSNADQGSRTMNNNDQSRSNADQGNRTGSTYANQESPGGTMKNVIDNPATKPQNHNVNQESNKCSAGGQDHKPGENSCNNYQKK